MMTQKGMVIGAKQFKGEVDGNIYDTCKLRVMMAVPSDSERECGFNVVELNYGKSDKFAALAQQQFPFEAELEFDVEIKSGKPVMSLRALKPVK